MKPPLRLIAIVAVAMTLGGCQTLIERVALPGEHVRQPMYAVGIERDVAIRAEDGVALVADIYRPQTDDASPTILVRIPFTKTLLNNFRADVVGRFWAGRGYNVVIQGTRGRYKSGGGYYPLWHERTDGIATLRWLGQQAWFDGRLGMWGGSTFGYTQWVVADQRDPGPSALAIQIASTDFHGMFYPGGAFSLESALFWSMRSRGREDEDPSIEAMERGFDGFPMIDTDRRAVGDIEFFKDWARHRHADAYWRAIDGHDRARTTKAPVLLMAGWSDPFLPTQLRDFQTIRREADPRVATASRLVIGPWTHADAIRFPDGSTAGDYRAAALAPSLPWFDHLLLGKPLDAQLAAPVRIYVMGENVWRDEHEWPLARTAYTSYYLSGGGHANSSVRDGRLLLEPPAGHQLADTYVYDPRNPVRSRGGAMLGPRAGIALQDDVEARSDVLTYSTGPLADDLEVTGPIEATLYVTTSATSTDFTVKLVDVHPDGRAYNVSDGILRRAFPLSAQSVPEQITIQLWPTSMLFLRGHRIRIEVSSSNYPRYDRNPNTGGDIATETHPMAATQAVYHSAEAPSRIVLPVIPRIR